MTWLRLLVAELPFLRDLPDLWDRPLPRVEVGLGSSVPGWALRAATVLVTAAMVAISTQRTTMVAGLAWTLVGVAAVAMAAIPAPEVAHVAVVASGLIMALGGHGPFDPVVFALLPLAYASVRLAWWCERLPLTARVETAALARGVPRALVLTAATAAFGVIAWLLAGHPNELAVVAGSAALVALAWLLFVRLASSSRPGA